MPSLKSKAIQLRKKQLSYRQIVKKLHVPKSTLHEWFKDLKENTRIKSILSKQAREASRLHMRSVGLKRSRLYQEIYKKYRHKAHSTYKSLKNNPLFLNGLALYWGEGDNKVENGKIRLSNIQPLMLKVFHIFIKRFLPEICDKTKMSLLLYPDHIDLACKKHWTRVVGVPLAKFTKSHYIIGKSLKRSTPYGIGTIVVSHRASKEMLSEWLLCFKKEIQNMRV